ncbi:C45 family autoproteolytic acyltransferase/hydolase [Oceanobacillus bengalensis]|uniref:Linear amide C-N hydrolase n=1 Tax=Oceanobacillus bengalensis TaxID=1435466 RepID=A0A494Z3Z0_9BACI|nr:C45 family peptidase [Oceanobacillus bengalensis]RKQ17161.1 linear amide C-N hydrolase [Oceanobacillus bengalensis]
MKKVFSNIVQYRGNHYDFGYMQGELLKSSPILDNRKKQWGSNRRQFNSNKDDATKALLTFAPGLLDEIQGLADSLQMDAESALKEFGGYYLEYGRSGCSIFTESDYMVRNYDNAPSTYEGRYVLYQPTDTGYATIGPSMQITGRTDGLNEKGLSLGYNFVHRKKSDDGFICNMIGRIVLENCKNIEEAVTLLKELPHRHSFNYALLDKSGESVIVEASPRRVETRKSNSCTNHFETLVEENRYRMDESVERLSRIKKQQNTVNNAYHAYQMMNDTEKGIFSKKYGAWAGTLHTAAYLPKEMKAWFALGGDRKPLILDFHKWLEGDKLHATKIRGELDSNSPFVNM